MRDWNAILRKATGEVLSARAMVDYFKPLHDWLKKESQEHRVGWS